MGVKLGFTKGVQERVLSKIFGPKREKVTGD
jgi:hypothetical protein